MNGLGRTCEAHILTFILTLSPSPLSLSAHFHDPFNSSPCLNMLGLENYAHQVSSPVHVVCHLALFYIHIERGNTTKSAMLEVRPHPQSTRATWDCQLEQAMSKE